MAHPTHREEAACPAAASCKLPHASCTPAAGVPAATAKSPFSLGTTIAIAVCAFVLAGAATLILGIAEKMRPIVRWLAARRPASRRED